MKFLHILIISTIVNATISEDIDGCLIPEDITLSRLSRLHHPCESNQNPYFAIEQHEDFYCIFYSTLGIFIFGAETKFEIKIEGNWSFEQVAKKNNK